MRPSIRLAALSRLRVVYVFTHDSVGVGEDGPTHQPVETVSALRMIPQLDVIRPADAEETAAAWAAACSRKDGPTALILSRQNLPNLKQVSIEERRQGTLKGGYVARKRKGRAQAHPPRHGQRTSTRNEGRRRTRRRRARGIHALHGTL
jgi:transketolase